MSSQSINPVKSFYKLHGRFGIGCIKFADGILSTAGRDGIIQNLQVDKNFFDKSESCEIQRSGSIRLKFSWLEKIVDFCGKIFVLGFHSDRFVVYNLTDGCVACEMSCGGSHRSWTFGLDDNWLTFTFIKEKTVEQFRYKLFCQFFGGPFTYYVLHAKWSLYLPVRSRMANLLV